MSRKKTVRVGGSNKEGKRAVKKHEKKNDESESKTSIDSYPESRFEHLNKIYKDLWLLPHWTSTPDNSNITGRGVNSHLFIKLNKFDVAHTEYLKEEVLKGKEELTVLGHTQKTIAEYVLNLADMISNYKGKNNIEFKQKIYRVFSIYPICTRLFEIKDFLSYNNYISEFDDGNKKYSEKSVEILNDFYNENKSKINISQIKTMLDNLHEEYETLNECIESITEESKAGESITDKSFKMATEIVDCTELFHVAKDIVNLSAKPNEEDQSEDCTIFNKKNLKDHSGSINQKLEEIIGNKKKRYKALIEGLMEVSTINEIATKSQSEQQSLLLSEEKRPLSDYIMQAITRPIYAENIGIQAVLRAFYNEQNVQKPTVHSEERKYSPLSGTPGSKVKDASSTDGVKNAKTGDSIQPSTSGL